MVNSKTEARKVQTKPRTSFHNGKQKNLLRLLGSSQKATIPNLKELLMAKDGTQVLKQIMTK